MQNNWKISSRQNFLNFLFFWCAKDLAISQNWVQLKVQNTDLSITITHINTESSWLKGCPGIYPSSFTNVRFWTKIEFLNVVKCRWISQGAQGSTKGSLGSFGMGSWGKASEIFWPFHIWSTNKYLKIEEI